MDSLEFFFRGFNVLLGIIMVLLGTKIYVPKFQSEESKENFYKKKDFFVIGGIAMTIWGVLKFF